MGKSCCQFTVGNNKSYQNKKGEWIKEVTFFDVTAWENLVPKCTKLKKGNRVFISGKLKRYDWKTKQGEARVKYYIEGKEINSFEPR